MKTYELNKKDFLPIKELSIINVAEFWDDIYVDYMQPLIDSFNKEYKWEEMFDIIDVENRIKQGHQLFILCYGEEKIGYIWFKKIDEDICFGYNLYVTKLIERPKNAPRWFCDKVSEFMLQKYKTIKIEIEDWNTVVFVLFESIGYKNILI